MLFQTTQRILLGPGTFSRLGTEAARLGARRVLLVSDPGLVTAGLPARAAEILSGSGLSITLHTDVEPDPGIETALAAARAAIAADADLVVGLGGGSAMDVAKVAAIASVNGLDLALMFGTDLVPRPGLPTILVPTTAGTGSEVTPISILSDHTEKLKKGIVSPYLLPATAIVDAELTVGVPPAVTAASGMDALLHAVEAFTSRNASPMSDLFATKAISLISANLRTAYADGSNIRARAAMSEGSMLAGIAFANAGVTAVHAFAYPIGAEFHIPHGVANSIMMGPVLAFNAIGNLDRFGTVATALGADTNGLSSREAAMKALAMMEELADDVGVPRRLAPFGVTADDIPRLSASVMTVTRLLANNPRRLTVDDAERLYRAVL
ncbi:alcohol dehydrogenase [Pseudoxanthobacter soli DSM 19599]|uniref:Alcohol dehydrogenase 2 n=1 Tax=Pseudoxanthobacter soli DSM 19599 TaxID=1123029 RepID=A0A1M7ZLY5_9HYPH|nr:iron-containing alcohol dehydrogenase [Pseudoxanthobacter soli]SHO65910.1 alcohol dehydrogenase [Pseudoxanthobacter soli DSM 19599]